MDIRLIKIIQILPFLSYVQCPVELALGEIPHLVKHAIQILQFQHKFIYIRQQLHAINFVQQELTLIFLLCDV
jgi:hypothetical protein